MINIVRVRTHCSRPPPTPPQPAASRPQLLLGAAEWFQLHFSKQFALKTMISSNFSFAMIVIWTQLSQICSCCWSSWVILAALCSNIQISWYLSFGGDFGWSTILTFVLIHSWSFYLWVLGQKFSWHWFLQTLNWPELLSFPTIYISQHQNFKFFSTQKLVFLGKLKTKVNVL